jgi:uncharacterized membrane-anchored protein YhcB (DUF1043 family)
MPPIVAISTPEIGMIGRTLDNNLNDSSHIPRFLPMSESRGKVYSLMETNSDTQTTESEASAAASRFAELQQLVAAMATDFEKFYRDGNKAAGTRVRNSMQELKAFAQRVREEVLTLRNQDKEQPQ